MADNINISPEMIDNMLNMLKSSGFSSSNSNVENSSNDTSSDTQNPLNNIDIDTIMKIKSIVDSLNSKNDNDTKLLFSLKPYLRKSRQAKLDQYINILKISQISKLLKNNLGDDH